MNFLSAVELSRLLRIRLLLPAVVLLALWLGIFTHTLSYRGQIFSANIVSAKSFQSDLSHRYILFLGGIRSSSPGIDGSPIDDSFSFIRDKLVEIGIPKNNFVYFSYSAISFKDEYCMGWGEGNCNRSDPSNSDTHLRRV